MKALVTADNNSASVVDVPKPTARRNEIRVKVHAIALNPVDALYTAHPVDKPGRVIGSDIAGVVDEVGEGVSSWQVGDRVAGLVQGATSANPRPGGFAEYAILEADLAIRVPTNVTYEEAATVPLCSLTAVQALFIRLELNAPFASPFQFPPPTQDEPTILIYSAATSVGLFAMQLAKLLQTSSGKPFKIAATASPRNFDKLRTLGADLVYNYADPNWVEQLKRDAGGVDYALDCISEGETTGKISSAFREGGGKIAVLRKSAWDKDKVRENVAPLYGAVWQGLGHEIIYNGETMAASPTWRQVSVEFFKWLSAGALNDSTRFPIQANPVRLMPGGLGRVPLDGFSLLGYNTMTSRDSSRSEELHMKPISGEKLVYKVFDSAEQTM